MTRLIPLLIAACLALPVLGTPSLAAADGCYICRSGSTCGQYCRYTGRDSWKNRKKCIKAGCKIGGTASCPKAANVRICAGAWRQDLSPRHAGRAPASPLRQTVVASTSAKRPACTAPY